MAGPITEITGNDIAIYIEIPSRDLKPGKKRVELYVCDTNNRRALISKIIIEIGEYGTKDNPLIINQDDEKFENITGEVYFKLGPNAKEGTYQIKYLEDSKTLEFLYANPGTSMGVVKKSSNDNLKQLYNVINVICQDGEVGTPKYDITCIEVIEFKDLPKSFQDGYGNVIETEPLQSKGFVQRFGREIEYPNLKNGYLNLGSSVSSTATYPTAYVLIKDRDLTAVAGGIITHNTTGTLNVTYKFDTKKKMDERDVEKADWLETTITTVLVGVGDTFLSVVQGLTGTDLTIDRLIFNEYEATSIDFFESSAGIAGQMKDVINYWFNVFRSIATLFYILVLLYVGIKTILTSTGGKKAKYKQLITDWVLGLLILFLFPYVMKYTIRINNGFISAIGGSRNSIITYYNKDILQSNGGGFYGESDYTILTIEQLMEMQASLNTQIGQIGSKIDNYKNNILNNGIMRTIYELKRAKQEAFTDSERRAITLAVDNAMNYVVSNIDYFVVLNENGYDHTVDLADLPANVLSAYYGNANDTTAGSFLDSVILACQNSGYTITKSTADYNCRELLISMAARDLKEVSERLETVNTLVEGNGGKTNDLMGEMRYRAKETGRIVYALVFYIMIYQLIMLLILYYKRVFMVAFLIVVFPFITITYVKDKVGDGKSQVLDTWLKEFLVNVLVQFLHAVLYVTLVSAGLRIYQQNPNHWMYFLVAILFLLPAERIFRQILGISGSTLGQISTIGRMAAGFAAGLSIGRAMRGPKEKDTKKDKQEDDEKDSATKGETSNKTGVNRNPASSSGAVNATEKAIEESKRNIMGTVAGTVKESAEKGNELKKKIRSVSSKVGAVVGTTVGLASAIGAGGKVSDVAAGVALGSKMGGSLANAAFKPIEYGANKISAMRDNRAIRRGALDEQMGLQNYDTKTADRIRKSVMRGNRIARTGGELKGQSSALGGKFMNAMPNLSQTDQIHTQESNMEIQDSEE